MVALRRVAPTKQSSSYGRGSRWRLLLSATDGSAVDGDRGQKGGGQAPRAGREERRRKRFARMREGWHSMAPLPKMHPPCWQHLPLKEWCSSSVLRSPPCSRQHRACLQMFTASMTSNSAGCVFGRTQEEGGAGRLPAVDCDLSRLRRVSSANEVVPGKRQGATVCLCVCCLPPLFFVRVPAWARTVSPLHDLTVRPRWASARPPAGETVGPCSAPAARISTICLRSTHGRDMREVDLRQSAVRTRPPKRDDGTEDVPPRRSAQA